MDGQIVLVFLIGCLFGFLIGVALNVKNLVEAYIQLDEYRRKAKTKNDDD